MREKRNSPQAQAIAELLERIGRAAHMRSYASGLNPAQWAALRFFSRANESVRTPTGFARANGTTHGTAALTISALVRKGYLSRVADPADRRIVRVGLTGQGRTLLLTDPVNDLVAAVGAIPPDRAQLLANELANLVQRFALRTD